MQPTGRNNKKNRRSVIEERVRIVKALPCDFRTPAAFYSQIYLQRLVISGLTAQKPNSCYVPTPADPDDSLAAP
jgi:hypothetical protein